MIIAFSLYRHCVYIIKTIALVKKSDVGIFLKYVSPPDAVNMNLGSRQIWETFNERNPAESEKTERIQHSTEHVCWINIIDAKKQGKDKSQ